MTEACSEFDGLEVVVAGQTFAASRTPQRAAAMRDLGCAVHTVPITPPGTDYETSPSLGARLRYRLRMPADPAGANRAIPDVAAKADILWLEAANMVRADTLRALKRSNPGIRIVWYSEDDMMNPRHRTRWLERAMPLIDLWATTKSLNVRPEERAALNLRRMLFVDNSYDANIHRPVEPDAADSENFGAPVSFIGTFEEPRAASMLRLAEAGLKVRVWGNGWERMRGRHPGLMIEGRPVYNDDFAKVVAASSVNLCFLRHANRDLQTCRSIELPACRGFMVHERNDEITQLLRESREAVYFSDDGELVDCCRYWLERDRERRIVAENGLRRVRELKLTHRDNVRRILHALFRETGAAA